MGERRKLSRIELAKPDHQEHSERRSRAFIPAALRRLDKLFKQQGPLSPVLRSVPDVQDLDNFIRGRVHDYVRRANEFACSFHLSGAAKTGEVCQLSNAVGNGLGDIPGGGGVVLLDVFDSGFKLISGFSGPPNNPHERNSRPMRSSTSLCSTNSPLWACSMPRRTPVTKRA